jgi:riboflavin kinase/FMN adenylyltransferase
MDVVAGIDRLEPAHGPLFAVIGVFDGLHRGHAYLLDCLRKAAAQRDARAGVITFDHHPDAVITGVAPPLLIDPQERLDRLAAAGVAVTIVEHFDDALRRTPYDTYVERIRARTKLAGFLMTPDAAFGFERRGTPESVAALGARDGFEVVVAPPFELDGAAVRSSAIRDAVAAGDLAQAHRMLGRPFTLTGDLRDGRVTFALPMAMPPDGAYPCLVDGNPATVRIVGGTVHAATSTREGRVTVELMA